MKSKIFSISAVAALAAGMAMAQTQPAPAQPPQHRRMANRQQWRHNRMQRMATYLNLTDTQKEQAKSIFQEARQTAQPVAQQLKQNRQAMFDAVKTDNEAQIDQLASTQANLMSQMVAIRTKAMAKVYTLLTPEQKAKADELHSRMQNRLQRSGPRGQNRG